jgi:hypothetical protein
MLLPYLQQAVLAPVPLFVWFGLAWLAISSHTTVTVFTTDTVLPPQQHPIRFVNQLRLPHSLLHASLLNIILCKVCLYFTRRNLAARFVSASPYLTRINYSPVNSI